MLDRKFIVENADLVAKNCQLRNSPADIAKFVQLESCSGLKAASKSTTGKPNGK